jgi:hypothetical protein
MLHVRSENKGCKLITNGQKSFRGIPELWEAHVTVEVVVWRDDECGMIVKENDDDRWSSDGMMLWLGRK